MSFLNINIEKQINGKICKVEIVPESYVYGINETTDDHNLFVQLKTNHFFYDLPFSKNSQKFSDRSSLTDNGTLYRYELSFRVKELLANTFNTLIYYQITPFLIKVYTENKVLFFRNMRLTSKINHSGRLLSYSGFDLKFYGENVLPVNIMSKLVPEPPEPSIYTVLFYVTDGSLALSDVNINFANQTKQTDENGFISYDVVEDIYQWQAHKEGYDVQSNTVNVDQDININIILNESVPDDYILTVIVKNKVNGNLLEGADVTIVAETKVTDENGEVQFTLPVNEYTWYVNKNGYKQHTGQVLLDENKTIELELEGNYRSYDGDNLRKYSNNDDDLRIYKY